MIKTLEARSLPTRASREFPLVMYRKDELKRIEDTEEEAKAAKAGFSRTPPAPLKAEAEVEIIAPAKTKAK